MKTLIIVLLTLTSSLAFAQNTATWIGGTPGNETNWNEPRNWSNYQMPDEDTHIIIKPLNTGHFAQPVISQPSEVASIVLYAGASLTIKHQGEVRIDGSQTYTQGILNYGGTLINEGLITLSDIQDFNSEHLHLTYKGGGDVNINGRSIKDTLLAKD